LSFNFIQVPPQSTGLKVDTAELTNGANTVERQIITLGDAITAANVAGVTAAGAVNVNVEGQKATYGASATFAVAASATLVWTLTGSASKTVRLVEVGFSSTTATAAQYLDIQGIKYSAAATGGTPVAETVVPFDSTAAAGTATVNHYTANGTPGAAVGTVKMVRYFSALTGTPAPTTWIVWRFGSGPDSGLVLRGVAQQFGISQATGGANAGTGDVYAIWTEE
jgi:hypothetical protein